MRILVIMILSRINYDIAFKKNMLIILSTRVSTRMNGAGKINFSTSNQRRCNHSIGHADLGYPKRVAAKH